MSRASSINRRLILSLGVIAVLVAILTLGLLWGIHWNDRREARISTRLYPAVLASDQIRASVINQQTALHGYFLTGNDDLFLRAQDARATYVQARETLLQEHAISPQLDALRDRQIQLVDDWYATVVVPLEGTHGRGAATSGEQVINLAVGDAQLDTFRAVNAAYEQGVRDRIAMVSQDVEQTRERIHWAAIGGSLLIVILTVVVSLHLIHLVVAPVLALQDIVEGAGTRPISRRTAALRIVDLDLLAGAIRHMLDSLQASGAEAELERSRFAAIVESADEGIVVVDADGIVSDMNPAACRLFDTDIPTAVGHPAADLGIFSDEELRVGLRPAQGAAPQPVVRKLGDRALSAIVSPLRQATSNGDRTGSVWVLRDVTELERVDAMKDEFISVVSHELRTPLTAIKGFTDLILEGEAGDITEEQRTFLEIVQSNSDRLVALINEMLDISRIESGRITLEREEINLSRAITTVLATLHPLISEKQQQVQSEMDDAAPYVHADEARLLQILTNLISNASKYTPAGGWITIRTEALEGQVAISISDTGMGIPPDALPEIFSKFYRVNHPASRDVTGTGLGLPITKSLVEMHGGRMNIASKLGIGTTVRFTMPSGRCLGDDARARATSSSAPPHVLVVSASEDDRQTWGERLERIPAIPVYARSQTHAAVVGEAEIHMPRVILIRQHAGSVPVARIFDEISHVLDLADTAIVVIGDEAPTDPTSNRLVCLPDGSEPEQVIEAVRQFLPAAAIPPLRRGRVLVAEDDQDTASWLRRILTDAGYEVTIVRDGLAAVVRTIEILPDAVILDVNMPRMGASEVLPQLRRHPGTHDIPIIVVTGAVPEARSYFIGAGASDFLTKPVDGGDLIQRLIHFGRRSVHG